MIPTLTILTPSIPEHEVRSTLLEIEVSKQTLKFNRYHSSIGYVEHVVYDTPSFLNGGPSIGRKRDRMIHNVDTEYLCFLDADDMCAPNYVESIMRMLNEGKPDVVTFRCFASTDFYWTLIDMSLNNLEDEQATPDRIVKRKPWLVCPVKTEYAKQFSFPDTNYSEDSIWMNQVLTLCKTEVHTDKILHTYRHSSKHSEADKITIHESRV